MKIKMNALCLAVTILLLTGSVMAQSLPALVPEPVSMKSMPGSFIVKPQTQIVTGNNAEVTATAKLFAEQVKACTGHTLKVVSAASSGVSAITLQLNKAADKTIGTEGYLLEVKASGIVIRANQPAGILYGLQTLLQMLPPDPESLARECKQQIVIPAVAITDYPRFGWRGLMLDVSRHFFTKEFVKKFIDHMVKYKYNVFHWHLSDDSGWRIAIKAYPQLTKVGAWRVPRTGRWATSPMAQPGEAATDGGFYTQDDIREIVKYAQQRAITIVPEIDVPGHSQALIVAYPAVSCTGEQYKVYPGSNGGMGDNVLCAGNEESFEMLDKIYGEIAALFPGQYIHAGGDEVNKSFWKACAKCQQRMKSEGLKDEHELQSYFIKRVEKILISKGKKLIGWDEILEGGLAPEATVMSWQGMEGGTAAAKAGHDVIMSPLQYCYLDYGQGEPATEHMWAGTRLSKTYQFEPVPPGVDATYILGGQGNVWTEFIATGSRVEYMTWPRALALSEVYWSPAGKRNWDSFVTRMEAQFPRFDQAGVKYAPSVYDADIFPVKDEQGGMKIGFRTEIADLKVYYTFDHSFPDNTADLYNGTPITIPIGATEIWAVTYRKGKPAGRLLRIGLDELKKR